MRSSMRFSMRQAMTDQNDLHVLERPSIETINHDQAVVYVETSKMIIDEY